MTNLITSITTNKVQVISISQKDNDKEHIYFATHFVINYTKLILTESDVLYKIVSRLPQQLTYLDSSNRFPI